MNNALKNVAYTDEYKKECMKFQSLFSKENKAANETIILSDDYKIVQTTYRGKVNDCNLHGNSCVLLNSKGKAIHTWNSFDDDAEFHTLIHHQNGGMYLVYRQELYGYTVFDLATNKSFQYYPQCVLDGCEYFIWTDVHYNPLNNLLAVSGCIWAAPWSTLIVNFENPMAEPEFQIDIIECLDGGYKVYNDADFVRWDGVNLILNCYNITKKAKEEVIVTPNVYLNRGVF
ncbi:hypothetical protein [Bacteroides sp. 519]|uniref:hypothetical protein n=1 Tax=Bacteroides sp. 519 TaxID=2302937 RepID=UPI0013D880C8|nr:hypothetical protein [Bacteroides sp. 519]NDV59080.1 hypothetical protein [Bacteroides sp. 519]